MSHPGPTLSEVEQLQEYQRLLAEMLLYVNPDLRTPLREEILMVEKQMNTLLSNYARQRQTILKR